ncbi:MAG TPA: DUF3656 domain-containing protein [Syntrophomonadaceae bacterium]|nr:DUF3656 domain-containing protein [Syntrophomonadaceae bacterium]
MELLAPAGNWEAFLAGINNGADAVYLGGKSFSARQYAANFSDTELKKAIEYAHIRERKIYITVNTLIDSKELNLALDYVYKLYHLGVDAVIVQDIGLMAAIRKLMPNLRVHASTQMTIHNELGATFLRDEGIKRIVLAREMSYFDLKNIREAVPDVEFEVFVHGALCYSYSGQCLFSSIVGGRSGNRGRCAGPCRLPYDLYNNTSKINMMGKGNHLISPADLCLINHLAALKEVGINSLKIEGRMKRPEYVAIVTKAYRQGIDELNSDENNIELTSSNKENLLKVFNRNFSTGFLIKENESAFLGTLRPDNRGVYLGKVVNQRTDFTTQIKLEDKLNIGDGIEIWTAKGKGAVSVVNEIFSKGQSVNSALKNDIISIKFNVPVSKDAQVYKNRDKVALDGAFATINEDDYKIDVDITLTLESGNYLKLIMQDDKGNKVEKMGSVKADLAINKPLDEKAAKNKIVRLGDTPFRLRNFYFSNPDMQIVPFSDLNETRRQASHDLLELRLNRFTPKKETLLPQDFSQLKNEYLKVEKHIEQDRAVKLSVFVSSVENAKTAVKAGADIVYVGMEGINKHSQVKNDDLQALAKWAENKGASVFAALARIQKPNQFNIGKSLLDIGFKNFMVSNFGALNWCMQNKIEPVADYTFNIYNPYSLRFLLDKKIKRISLSPELNLKQINQFPDLSRVELIVHGDLILMTSEYCMLTGVLGNGKHPCKERYCEHNNYFIQDEKGFRFPVTTDAYCRFYVFNSRTLSMLEDLEKLTKKKPYALRIEAHRLSGEQLTRTVSIYRQVLEQINSNSKPDLLKAKLELTEVSSSPFTKGHYYRGVL